MQTHNKEIVEMITKHYGKDFSTNKKNFTHHDALTLDPGIIGNNASGWTVEGQIHEDWYEWVNEFEATHPDFGRVWGDFENIVYADSEEGFAHFYEHHEPIEWDYWDI